MGCGESNLVTGTPQKVETNFGQLTVHVMNAHLTHVTSTVAEMDPFMVIKFGRQQFQTSTKFKGGKDVEFKEKFIYVINSCYQSLGRLL